MFQASKTEIILALSFSNSAIGSSSEAGKAAQAPHNNSCYFSNAAQNSKLLSKEEFAACLAALMAQLQRLPQLRIGCCFSGLLLDKLSSLSSIFFEEVRSAVLRGQLEIIAGLHFEPCFELCSKAEAAEHLELNQAFWQHQGFPLLKTYWHNNPSLPSELLSVLAERNLNTLILPRELITACPENGSGVFVYQGQKYALLAQHHPGLAFTANNKQDTDTKQDWAFPASLPDILEYLSQLAATSNLQWCLPHEINSKKQLSQAGLNFTPWPSQGPRSAESPKLQADFFSSRLALLRQELESIPQFIATHEHQFESQTKLKEARSFFLRAQHAPAYLNHKQQLPPNYHAAINEPYANLIRSQVQIDSILHAEIDPIQGYLNAKTSDYDQDGEEELIIETPFQESLFKPSLGGAMIELIYKPRKLNFIAGVPSAKAKRCFTGRLLKSLDSLSPAPPPCPADIRILNKSPDSVRFRIAEPLNEPDPNVAPSPSWTSIRDFSFRGNLGAYQANATTGFAVEYWLEKHSSEANNCYFSLDFSVVLASGKRSLASFRPLLCFGGITEESQSLEQECVLDSSSAPGGLYGVRLIDGLASLVIDLRSAKALSSIRLSPQEFPQAQDSQEGLDVTEPFCAIQFQFISSADKLLGDDHANTLFFSVY